MVEKFNSIRTPFYYYNMELLHQTLNTVTNEANKYGFVVHYAMKANANPKVLRTIASYGIGADCVSGGEVQRAADCGFTNNHIVFAGVGKSDEEINTGLANNIHSFNCESLPEIEIIDELAKKVGKIAKIAIRINPNVDAKTHEKITTGLEENKFGINPWDFENLLELLSKLQNVELTGMHFHIGSQITDLSVFKGLCIRIKEFKEWFANRNVFFKDINAGGGFGIDYEHPDEVPIPDFKAYFALFHEFLELDEGQQLHFELGRSVTGQFGSLVSRVLYIKEGGSKKFAVLDAGMNDLMRPALYQAYHKIENWSNSDSATTEKYDVVGPICESSDQFGKEVSLPITKRGDFVVMRSAGAYGETMANTYNLRQLPGELFSDEI